MKKLRGYLEKILIVMLIVSFLSIPQLAYGATSKTVTVDTQKELAAALADKDVTQIIISTKSKVKFYVPDKDYTGKKLVLKAPYATITNKGEFKSVRAFVSTQWQLNRALKNGNIDFINIQTTATVKFVINGDHPEVSIVINAINSTVAVNGELAEVIELRVQEVTRSEIVKEDPVVKPEPTVIPEVTPVAPDVVPSFPMLPSVPSVPSTPSVPEPTPVVVIPTPTPVVVEPTPVVTPPVEDPELTALKDTYKANVITATNELHDYLSYYEWLDFQSGFVAEKLAQLDSYTDVNNLNNNYTNSIMLSINNYKATVDRFVNDNPYSTNVVLPTKYTVAGEDGAVTSGSPVYTAEQIASLQTSTDPKFGNAIFSNEGRNYNVDVNGTHINTVTLDDPQVNVVTGSAVSVNILAWNNVDIIDGVVELTLERTLILYDPILDEYSYNFNDFTSCPSLVAGDYEITESKITLTSQFTSQLDTNYVYMVTMLTEVPYILSDAKTGTSITILPLILEDVIN